MSAGWKSVQEGGRGEEEREEGYVTERMLSEIFESERSDPRCTVRLMTRYRIAVGMICSGFNC